MSFGLTDSLISKTEYRTKRGTKSYVFSNDGSQLHYYYPNQQNRNTAVRGKCVCSKDILEDVME